MGQCILEDSSCHLCGQSFPPLFQCSQKCRLRFLLKVTGEVAWFGGVEFAFLFVTLWCTVAPTDRPSVKKFLRLGICRGVVWSFISDES